MHRDLRLADGRRLSYTGFGGPDGLPCLLVHGFSSSRLLAGWAFSRELLERHGVRFIAVDRPGYGRSSPNPGAGFLSWAGDAVALAEDLGLERLAVLGVSMGAGPALALASARPDLVTSTTILSGMAPLGARERMNPAARADALYWRLARVAPWLLRRLCDLSAKAMTRADRAERLIAGAERAMPDADLRIFRKLIQEEPARAAFAADARESGRQGGGGMLDDLLTYLRPWGFDPATVRGSVRWWHGVDDPKVPVALARRLTERLTDGAARFVPGGHFAPFAHLDEILAPIGAEA